MPINIAPFQWICHLRTLKQMDMVRRQNQQVAQIEEFNKHNAEVAARGRSQMDALVGNLAAKAKAEVAKEADRLGISEHSIRNRMKGVRWDDTKKVLRKMREQRAGLK